MYFLFSKLNIYFDTHPTLREKKRHLWLSYISFYGNKGKVDSCFFVGMLGYLLCFVVA